MSAIMDKTLYDLIVPKLEAVENAGDGALIHEVRHHLHAVKSMQLIAEFWEDNGNNEKAVACISKRDKYIKDAENWLIEIGRKL